MAAELEEMVLSRVKNSSAQKMLQGAQESISKQSNCSRTEQLGLEELTEFFSDLKSALGNADPETSFQFLNHARSNAKELIQRQCR